MKKAAATGTVVVAITICAVMSQAQADEVNLYSARKEALIKPLLDKFTEQTGIEVNLVTAKADALLARLKSEGKLTPADVFITVDAGRLHRAKAADLFQPIDSATLNSAVPEQYRDPDGVWYGLSLRARPIMYVKGKLDPAKLTRYEDLSDAGWKGRICIRSSGNIYNQSLVASMIAADGEADTEQWARGLVANLARPPAGGDRDQIKAAAAGQCDIAVANTYYLARMLGDQKDDAQRMAAEKMAIIWPNQGDRGTHVNISGAGITRHSKNRENAIKLLEFLASDDSQNWYAEVNHEYPVKAGVEISDTLKSLGEFKADSVNLNALGENNAAAVKLMDRAGWR
jgi:iron(III) transport system substrate-binding protein